ncbi:MAG: tetratricopeptide repeat protein [Bacteroidota bacterium]|nr:tetratricopeptide repeat protein [Bacteroidota bacterium]
MKRFFLSVCFTVLLLLLQIVGQTQALQIKTFPVDEKPQHLFDFCTRNLSHLDSPHLFRTMDSVRTMAWKQGDKKLVWYAELFQTVFLSYKRSSADAERLLLAKKQYFETSPYPEIKGSCYFFLGSMYYARRDFEKSFYYYINANDVFESLGYDKVPLIGFYSFNFFRLYYQVGDYPSAIRTLEHQIKNNHPQNEQFLPFDYNNLGVTYLKFGELQKAQDIFLKSLYWARQTGNTVYTGIASGNYGNTLRLQGYYSRALPYLYTDVAINKDTAASNCAISCVYIANALLHLDSISKADRYLDSALLFKPDWIWSSFGREYYATKSFYYKKTGNYEMALLYQDSLLQLRDSLKPGKDVALFKAIALQFKDEKAVVERHTKELEKGRLRLTRDLIVAFSVLLLLSVTAYFVRQRKKERTLFQHQQRGKEEKLLHAEAQLEAYLDAIKEKNKIIERIEATIEKSQENGVDNKQTEKYSVQRLTDHPLLTENDWQEFKTLFTLVHPEFFTSLHHRYPGLSHGETRVLSLCKLQISSLEMAAMLGISLQSVRTSRYRLRKKHPNLIDDPEFAEFI